MVEAAQVRAARALIGWSQAKLAETAGVPVSTIDAFETGAPDPIANEAVDKMRAALETAGVVFIPKDGGGGIGVRLREALEGEYIGWNDLNASNDELNGHSASLPPHGRAIEVVAGRASRDTLSGLEDMQRARLSRLERRARRAERRRAISVASRTASCQKVPVPCSRDPASS